MENHHVVWVNPRFLWPFSIAFFYVYQAGYFKKGWGILPVVTMDDGDTHELERWKSVAAGRKKPLRRPS